MNFKELGEKKFLNVPVLYWAGAFVLILAVVAWRMKASPGAADTGGDTTSEDAGKDTDPDYSGLSTGGTVTVVQTPASSVTTPANNTKWEQDAIGYLMKNKNASATEAQKALHHYLNGEDLTFEEKGLVDAAVMGVGLPPDGTAGVGIVGTAPAQKQFSNYPGTHVVKNTNDNTPAKISQLYYGTSDANHVNLIVAKNPEKGPAGTTYVTGTSIVVPKWEDPKYYVTVHETRFTDVARKNGISRAFVVALNPGVTEPFKIKGTKLRVG